MANTGNLLFDVSTEVGEEIFRAKKQAMKSKAVEFGKRWELTHSGGMLYRITLCLEKLN